MDAETCYSPGSIAGAVLGTFVTTCLLIAVAALFYRQWRRNKGKHLVLVTDPEIVEEAYAFDNPCFKDVTPAVGRSLERNTQLNSHSETTPTSTPVIKDHFGKWTAAWSNLGRSEKRRTLDDSVLGPNASRVSVVSLRSRDFTGLGFNVCGNMREGIFVKDLLHRGPASESGRIHPGDRISSVKISFRSMVYEDALTILSYASPYDVEIEVESGGSQIGPNSKPSTLLKKTVSPSPAHICHPLYRSQSIPELAQTAASSGSGNRKHASKRLFAADFANDSSTLKSTGKSTLERNEAKTNHHTKFGIKVLPALDGTVHRIENQNEHNTNLERRNSRKIEEKRRSSHETFVNGTEDTRVVVDRRPMSENLQQRSAQNLLVGKKVVHVTDGSAAGGGIDVPDRAAQVLKSDDTKPTTLVIPSEVPTEVHNAAMAARGKRKSVTSDVLNTSATKITQQQQEPKESKEAKESVVVIEANNESKSPQKGKRKAPAPPSRSVSTVSSDVGSDDKPIDVEKVIETVEGDRTVVDLTSDKSAVTKEADGKPIDEKPAQVPSPTTTNEQERTKRATRRNSESDTDSEVQHSFTTIELKPSDITIHSSTAVEAVVKDRDEEEDETADDDDDDNYRKAASLGDLSKYESKNTGSSTLERAQSLDMTDAAGSKKRKAPMPPPEDINESTEDLTKLDKIDPRGKLKKSSEWGTLEDAIWKAPDDKEEQDVQRIRKKSNTSGGGTLERSKSNVETKTKEEKNVVDDEKLQPFNVSDGALETSIELYNLPLSKRLTEEFIASERLFDPQEDNALSRLVNDGEIVKTPTAEELDQQFRKAHPLPDIDYDDDDEPEIELEIEDSSPEASDTFEKAVKYFDALSTSSPVKSSETKVILPEAPEDLYAGKKEVVEEPMSKVILNFSCPGCDHDHGKHSESCAKNKVKDEGEKYHQTIKVEDEQAMPNSKRSYEDAFETHYAKPIINIPDDKSDEEDVEAIGSVVTVNSKNLSPSTDKQQNISNVSISSEANKSKDMSLSLTPTKLTYVTEIKVLPSNNREEGTLDEVTVTSNGKLPVGKKPPVPPRRTDTTRYVSPEKQVVYVSEYKSPAKDEKPGESGSTSKKYENWIYLKDNNKEQEIHPWGNGSSPSQPVTSIVLSNDENIVRK